MLQDVDLGAMRAQAEAIGEAYRRNEVEVHVMHPSPSAPPNIIFMRDLFFMTPSGAVLGRMASQQRAGEERHVARALAWAGFPILRTVTGRATFEGADALWLDDETVVIGVGFRTNGSGAEVVRDVLREQRIRAVTVPLGTGVQHLLGSTVFLDERLAAIDSSAVDGRLRDLLRERDYELIEFEPTAELLTGRGMNVVTIAPRHVLMPAGAPSIRRKFEVFDVEVEEIETGEYLKAAGGIGCLTGILCRE
jgi:N-dimethylarginine dimethylaminohydrolase